MPSQFNGERKVFSVNDAGTTGHLYGKKGLWFLPHTMHEN